VDDQLITHSDLTDSSSFLPCEWECHARSCCRLSVCLSVRPSVCQTRAF